ncbi:hypothetical protein [Clostridium sp. DJ247]|uniref:hypothetical protein n=1 Tax=Clostridium sp. DJ247 TaxID=2726188 RepID=UPI001623A113|nr:hypothetical protein [Clostridium sp. DJ247]MBC2580112.1 hypothetical protein [Clostridium sp. DJ247]
MLEIRWLENGRIKSKQLYDINNAVTFKNKLFYNGIENVHIYYKNKRIVEIDNDLFGNEFSQMFNIADIYLISYEVDAIDDEEYDKEYYKNNKLYFQNKLDLVTAELNYVLDTYPLNEQQFKILSEEFIRLKNKI